MQNSSNAEWTFFRKQTSQSSRLEVSYYFLTKDLDQTNTQYGNQLVRAHM